VDRNATLAACNVVASVVSLGFAIAGLRAIRRKRIRAHRNCMVVAVAASFVFLVLFVVRFATYGFAPFAGDGAADVIYTIVLYTHEPLAVVNIPLVLAALVLGLRRADRAHREVAPVAFWIWVYVLASGIALYLLLYVY
jgi:putative membrane protein